MNHSLNRAVFILHFSRKTLAVLGSFEVHRNYLTQSDSRCPRRLKSFGYHEKHNTPKSLEVNKKVLQKIGGL